MRNMVRGDKYEGKLQVGQRVCCGLYGGMDGIITAIHGEQRPETIKRLFGGAGVMGGNANIEIVFLDHHAHISRGTPEGIIRGVQWDISDEIASQGEIELALLEAEVKKHNDEVKAKQAAEQRAKTRAALPSEYPYLIVEKAGGPGGHVLAAKNIRLELARAFPGIKFSVRSSSFAGGNDVTVSWTNGPTTKEVKAITGKYQEGHFDGMNDIYEYDREGVWCDVFGGAKYVSESRHIDAEGYTAMVKDLCTMNNVPYSPEEWRIQIGNGYGETATHIVNVIEGQTSIPAGAKITGLESIPFAEGETCRAGGWHEFYRIKLELAPATVPCGYQTTPTTCSKPGVSGHQKIDCVNCETGTQQNIRAKSKNSVLDLILSD
jgi:hypothetical protein